MKPLGVLQSFCVWVFHEMSSVWSFVKPLCIGASYTLIYNHVTYNLPVTLKHAKTFKLFILSLVFKIADESGYEIINKHLQLLFDGTAMTDVCVHPEYQLSHIWGLFLV